RRTLAWAVRGNVPRAVSVAAASTETKKETNGPDPGPREDLLHPDSGRRRGSRRPLLRDRLRLEHPPAQQRRGCLRRHGRRGERYLGHREAALLGARPRRLRDGRERWGDPGDDPRGRRGGRDGAHAPWTQR